MGGRMAARGVEGQGQVRGGRGKRGGHNEGARRTARSARDRVARMRHLTVVLSGHRGVITRLRSWRQRRRNGIDRRLHLGQTACRANSLAGRRRVTLYNTIYACRI